MRPGTDAATVAGFVAAEGCFTRADRNPFRFAIALGAADTAMVAYLHEFFGVGNVNHYPRRKPHYDDEVVFAVRSLRDLVEVIVPFMDEHLPSCHKRTQYEQRRAKLLDYWEHHARRRRVCPVEGCERPQRAKRLCRGHYYQRYGR